MAAIEAQTTALMVEELRPVEGACTRGELLSEPNLVSFVRGPPVKGAAPGEITFRT